MFIVYKKKSHITNFHFLLLTIFFVSSCSHFKKNSDEKEPKSGIAAIIENVLKSTPEKKSVTPSEQEDLGDSFVSEASNDKESVNKEEISKSDEETDVEEYASIQVVENESVQKWINYFTKKDRERFQRMLNRGEILREVVQNILKENGIPVELYYLGLIESGYVTKARSTANAVGPWQFMKGTGKRYGLQIDHVVDERLDPIRATQAAARYLRNLYNVFQSWELVMSAYNSGEYRVLGAVMKAGDRDYWKLRNKKLLPKETREYVPKFMAAAIIGQDPEKYGFSVEVMKEDEYPDLELIEIPAPMQITTLAKATGISIDDLRHYNPHLLKGYTPRNGTTYEVWIKTESKDRVEKNWSNLISASKQTTVPSVVVNDRLYHVVRRGENLNIIAKKYSETVSHLKQINNLKRSTIYPGQKIRLVAKAYKKSPMASHRVRSGENLNILAKRYGMTIPSIKRVNNLKNSKIYVGQILKVKEETEVTYHKVKRGENLNVLARKYRTSVREIKNINNLAKNRIFVGQVLRIN